MVTFGKRVRGIYHSELKICHYLLPSIVLMIIHILQQCNFLPTNLGSCIISKKKNKKTPSIKKSQDPQLIWKCEPFFFNICTVPAKTHPSSEDFFFYLKIFVFYNHIIQEGKLARRVYRSTVKSLKNSSFVLQGLLTGKKLSVTLPSLFIFPWRL